MKYKKITLDGVEYNLVPVGEKTPKQSKYTIGETLPDGTVYIGEADGKHWVRVPNDKIIIADWYDSMTYAKNLNFAGRTDWQLPNQSVGRLMVADSYKKVFGDFKLPDTWLWLRESGVITADSLGTDDGSLYNVGKFIKGSACPAAELR